MKVSFRTPMLGAAHPNHSAPSLGSCFGLMTPFVRLSPNYFNYSENAALPAHAGALVRGLNAKPRKSRQNPAVAGVKTVVYRMAKILAEAAVAANRSPSARFP